jgi:hypothetical protein
MSFTCQSAREDPYIMSFSVDGQSPEKIMKQFKLFLEMSGYKKDDINGIVYLTPDKTAKLNLIE